jgi:glutamate synthase domain-containing protein 1
MSQGHYEVGCRGKEAREAVRSMNSRGAWGSDNEGDGHGATTTRPQLNQAETDSSG